MPNCRFLGRIVPEKVNCDRYYKTNPFDYVLLVRKWGSHYSVHESNSTIVTSVSVVNRRHWKYTLNK